MNYFNNENQNNNDNIIYSQNFNFGNSNQGVNGYNNWDNQNMMNQGNFIRQCL